MPVMSTATKIKCPKCRGTGRADLTYELQNTLDVVRMLKTATSEKIAERLKWPGSPTAINNRLDNLLKLGLVTRVRTGKWFAYSVAK